MDEAGDAGVGAGFIADFHLDARRRTPGVEVVAVCDVYKPHLERGIEAGNNPDANRYVDYRELLADPVSARLGFVDAEKLRAEYDRFVEGDPVKHDFWWPLTAEMWLSCWRA